MAFGLMSTQWMCSRCPLLVMMSPVFARRKGVVVDDREDVAGEFPKRIPRSVRSTTDRWLGLLGLSPWSRVECGKNGSRPSTGWWDRQRRIAGFPVWRSVAVGAARRTAAAGRQPPGAAALPAGIDRVWARGFIPFQLCGPCWVYQGNDVHSESQFFTVVAGAAGGIDGQIDNPHMRICVFKIGDEFSQVMVISRAVDRDLELFIRKMRQQIHRADGQLAVDR